MKICPACMLAEKNNHPEILELLMNAYDDNGKRSEK
jgi:hypothetical protein